MSQTICFVDGEFMDIADARISVLDRGLLMGDAIYEVARVQNRMLFRVLPHYERMRRGLDFLQIPVPFSPEEFGSLCRELRERNDVDHGFVYLQVSRGAAMRTHLVPKGLKPTVLGYAGSVVLPKWHDFPEGAPVITTRDLRWGRCDMKTTMLLPNSLAMQKARDAGALEAILVAEDGVCHEGCSSSLFAAWDGTVRTHPADHHILHGITRAAVIEIARENGIPVREETFTRDQLMSADEAMLAGTTMDVCPVVQIDGLPVGDGAIGPVTHRLMKLFAELMQRELGG